MSTITVTVHLLEEDGDPIATCTTSGPGFTVVSDVADPRRFSPQEAALNATYPERGMRERARIHQVGTARIGSVRGLGATRQSLYTFQISEVTW
ncbi:MAG: hypothetical protein HZY73_12465 [Micropruina sp.]|nr:MAG: hypothetical protein HZY73_12465 [Micropruina sp.]